MEPFSTGFPHRRARPFAPLLVLAALASAPVRAEIFTDLLDPRKPSFSAKTELADTIVSYLDAARGNPPDQRRKARRAKGPLPCPTKGRAAARLLKDGSVAACVEYAGGMLRLRTRRAGSDSVVEWIPVRLSEMPRSSLEVARFATLEGSTLLELELLERSGESEGRQEDRSLVLIDPVRERFLVNVMRSHSAEGNRDEANFTESCEGVAAIRGNRIVLGGYACQEESEGETESGEITTYTRSSGPDPEFVYRYRDGLLFQER